ncbi:MAG: hypothetical protein JXP73_05700 [Deltaproteobacteria bacterium]|nr:hypothetical protein [Deltaproteobacteria bacterium]
MLLPLAVMVVVVGCTETFSAGSSPPHGLLPVDERNPIVLVNDSNYDNWHGEYAVLLANSGGPGLAGIIVGTSPNATDIDANVADWRDLVAAARASGLRNIPDPIASIGAPLRRPASGDIDATVANRSEGALFIVNESARRSLAYRPLVVQTGGRLTDVADAYLVDPTVVDRVFIVSSLGTLSSSGAVMGRPNGEMDPWADSIVTARFRYIQISAYHDQMTDVPAARLSELPQNPFGDWIAAKQPRIWNDLLAADQGGVAALGVPGFVTAVDRVSAVGPVAAGASAGPDLLPNPNATAWLVTQIAGTAAKDRFWQLLLDPATFAP